jgi:hypothetical protein
MMITIKKYNAKPLSSNKTKSSPKKKPATIKSAPTPQCEADWQAQGDARTLMEAKVIVLDPKRLTAAQVAAKKMADEKMAEALAMRKVAGKKPKG